MNHQKNIITLADKRLIGYAEYGDPNGMPIFYFHGFPGSRLEASRFNHVAATNHYRLIGIDRPGMGLSSIDKKSTLLSWATDVAHSADTLNIERFSIVGHSGGAPFIAACAYAIAERLNGAAIVSGMAPLENHDSEIGMARGQIIVKKLIQRMPFLTAVMMKLTLIMLKNPNKVIAQMIKKLPERDQNILLDPIFGKMIIDSTTEAFRNGTAGPAHEMNLIFNPWKFELQNITCPVTIWQGTLDTQAPLSHAHIYANSWPFAKLNIIENEGHHSLLQNHIKAILKSSTA